MRSGGIAVAVLAVSALTRASAIANLPLHSRCCTTPGLPGGEATYSGRGSTALLAFPRGTYSVEFNAAPIMLRCSNAAQVTLPIGGHHADSRFQ
jgi:hypothetical protein